MAFLNLNSSSKRLQPIILLLLSLTPTFAAAQAAQTVRACDYIPGVSVPAVMPPDLANAPTLTPAPTGTPFAPTQVDAAATALQLKVYNGLGNAVNDHYVYTDFNGHDWKAVGASYQALIKQGLNENDFYLAMSRMIAELGDDDSYFESPKQVEDEKAEVASQYNFVGIGALLIPIPGTQHASIMTVFHNSPAADAGFKPHDTVLQVDGGPIRDDKGISRTLGLEGKDVIITVQRPGEQPRDITVTRHRVTGMLPIDYCIVPNTHIGYLFLPTLLDETIGKQVQDALEAMTEDGALQGLVLDNRVNGGGLGSVTQTIMELFASGEQGTFISRDKQEPLTLQPHDIGGSQTLPLVILVDTNTVSYGEIMSGVLRLAGRATIIGGTTLGNVERLLSYNLPDGSRLWLASQTFQPQGEANGIWEQTGIIPDISVPTRWDLFTEATDPALAEAVEFLTQGK